MQFGSHVWLRCLFDIYLSKFKDFFSKKVWVRIIVNSWYKSFTYSKRQCKILHLRTTILWASFSSFNVWGFVLFLFFLTNLDLYSYIILYGCRLPQLFNVRVIKCRNASMKNKHNVCYCICLFFSLIMSLN